jgi:molybdopterin converting factor small subunit
MTITICFYSYFKDLTGTGKLVENFPNGMTLGQLQDVVAERFPKLASMKKSTLAAVGVEYQGQSYVLKDGDEVSLFPPVQGG